MKRSAACSISWLALLAVALAAPGVPDRYRIDSAETFPGYTSDSLPTTDTPARRVTLPLLLHAWPGQADYQQTWVRLNFPRPASPALDLGVYIPRISPAAELYANGNLIGTTERFGGRDANSWNYPLYLQLPPVLVHAGDNELLVHFAPNSSARTDVGPVWVGSKAALYPQYRWQLWKQVLGVETVSLAVAFMGLLALMLWLRRRHDVVFGLFALSCALWILRNSQFFVVADLFSHFRGMTDAALFWLVVVLYILSFRILGDRFPRLERAAIAYAVVVTAAFMLFPAEHYLPAVAFAYAVMIPGACAFMLYLTRRLLRRPSVLIGLLWLAALVTSTAGAYDLALMQRWIAWPGTYLMPYSALFYALTVGWALIDRFVRTQEEYAALNVELESRVRQRETQLATQYAATAELQREQAVRVERERFLRDMHDGLGLQLISARRLVESGDVPRERVAALLGEAMDELRIAIDSVKPGASDLLMMLGNLRYRLEPRLADAGIRLEWDVSGVSELRELAATQVAEITRIVQEACTNAIKHSHATAMSLMVREEPGGAVEVVITDNGTGFDTEAAARGEGLRNMRTRARRLGAACAISSRPGETRIALTLPPPPPAG